MHDNYLRLLEGLAKKREFEAVYVEREMELEDLRRRHTEMKRELEILTRAKEDSISDAQSAVRKDFCDGERDCRDDVCELEKELL